MVDHDPQEKPLPVQADAGTRCPWCSALVASPEDVTCRSCGATLHGDAAIEIPGVTAIDVLHVLRTAPPRKVRGTLGSLLVGGDDEISQPSEAELTALAMPDPEVRREMLRLRLDAELVDLTARAEALAAVRGSAIGASPGAEPDPDAPGEPGGGPGAGPPPVAGSHEPAAADPSAAGDATPPEDDLRR